MAVPAEKLPAHMTAAEFVAWRGGIGGAKQRLQLVDGEVRAQMSRASAAHGTIRAELAFLIRGCLIETDRKSCRVITEGAVQPRARSDFNVRVPDLTVTCTPATAGEIIVPDPVLLIEILSPGNAQETWANVWAYTTIPSVAEILIVSSFEIAAQHLQRDANGHWPADPRPLGADDALQLASVGLDVPFAQIYAQTYLTREQA